MALSPEQWETRIIESQARLLKAKYGGADWPRGRSSWFTLLSSDEPRHVEGAIKGMREALDLRISDPASADCGHFWWTADQRDKVGRVDPNTLCFYAFDYLQALGRYQQKIPADIKALWGEVIEAGFVQAMRRDIHAGYTNIACLIPAWLIMGGEQFGLRDVLDYAGQKLKSWLTYQRLGDAPREYASPNYTPVALRALAAIVECASDGATRAAALEGEQSIWRHVARRYHLPTRQVAGPHSRVYSQDASFPLLAAAAGLDDAAGDPGMVLTTPFHPPDGFEDLFMKRAYPQFLSERVDPFLDPKITMYLGGSVGLCAGKEGRLKQTHLVHSDNLMFRTCRTFFAEEFTLGSIDFAQAGAQRNNFVMHCAGRSGRLCRVYERVTFDGRQFFHMKGYGSAFTDQEGPAALLLRKVHKIEPPELLPYDPPVDKSAPVEEVSFDVYLPARDELDELFDGGHEVAGSAPARLESGIFSFRAGAAWAGFRLGDAAGRWEIVLGDEGLILRHVFWRRGGPDAMSVAVFSEAGSVSLRDGSFAGFRERLAAGSFVIREDAVEFHRPGLDLNIAQLS